MSLKTVQLIVGRLVTDEEYRLNFLSDPVRAASAFCVRTVPDHPLKPGQTP